MSSTNPIVFRSSPSTLDVASSSRVDVSAPGKSSRRAPGRPSTAAFPVERLQLHQLQTADDAGSNVKDHSDYLEVVIHDPAQPLESSNEFSACKRGCSVVDIASHIFLQTCSPHEQRWLIVGPLTDWIFTFTKNSLTSLLNRLNRRHFAKSWSVGS